MRATILLLFTFTSLLTTAQESILLRLNHTKGDSYLVTNSIKQNVGTQGGMDMNTNTGMIITAVSKEGFKAESQVTSIAVNMTRGGISMSYDSSKKDGELDQMGQALKSQFAPMVSAVIYTTSDNKGNITDTKIEPSNPAMKETAKNIIGIQYPEEKVTIGSTWESINEKAGIKINTTYTVKSIANGTAILKLTGTVSGLGNGTTKGETTIDIKSGIPTSSVSETTISTQGIEISISGSTRIAKI